MPPFIQRKRRPSTHQDAPAPKSLKKGSLFDAADKPTASATLQDSKSFLEGLDGTESSLSEITGSESEKEFSNQNVSIINDLSGDEEDEEIGWEDAIDVNATPREQQLKITPDDIVLDLNIGDQTHFINSNPHSKKRGPTKVERQIRVATHCMHVQFLLFHNLTRNAWCCDKELQSVLVNQLPSAVKREVDKWRLLSGIEVEEPLDPLPTPPKEKQRREAGKISERERNQREWGGHAEKQEIGVPNLSRGDPLIRLLKVLASYWKKRFTITAPGLRKQGYKSLATLENEVASFKHDEHDVEKHGERLEGVRQLRYHSRTCEGSRDVGAQLFTALIRGLGIEARLVASLQPVGYGWGKGEEAAAKKKKKEPSLDSAGHSQNTSQAETGLSVRSTDPKLEVTTPGLSRNGSGRHKTARKLDTPIHISDDSDAPLVRSKPCHGDVDDEILIEPTRSSHRMKRNLHYDRDIVFPTYWTEAVSPITSDIFPVESFLLSPAVATSEEHLAGFEARGVKAEKAKQIFAYIIAYSWDGTAKDVTTRYLRRHTWPGRTKGVRLPVEKMAVYNRNGKVKYYEDYDWFKTVMSGYMRTSNMRTAVDDVEEAKDLVAFRRERKEPKGRPETLQGYKTSADFVLERHLRREEAILPGSEPVKTFITGKGENSKEEPVYSRKDVTICRTGESWHKEGRQVKAGEQPIKMVPVRAVTLSRKREVEEAERAGGKKVKQGLYAWDQTDWIIPPPIQNGVIPKNAFGNMDCYVPTMVPRGAVHVPLKSTSKICKRLGIDFAEACTGFEFGNQRAVPVITGVVVAAEHEDVVIAEWEKDEVERKVKEEGKRERIALAAWRKMLMGLRIMKRVQEDYGGDADGDKKDDMNPFTNKSKNRLPTSIQEVGPVPADKSIPRDSKDTKGVSLMDDTGQENYIAEEDSPFSNVHNQKYSRKIDPNSSDMEGGGFIMEPEDNPNNLRASLSYPWRPTPGIEVQVKHDTNLMNNNNNISNPSHDQPHPSVKYPKYKDKNPRNLIEKTLTRSMKSARAQSLSATCTPNTSTPLPAMKGTPTRRTAAAVARSEGAVRSQYFTHNTTDGDDDDDDDYDQPENSNSEEAGETPFTSKLLGKSRASRLQRGAKPKGIDLGEDQ